MKKPNICIFLAPLILVSLVFVFLVPEDSVKFKFIPQLGGDGSGVKALVEKGDGGKEEISTKLGHVEQKDVPSAKASFWRFPFRPVEVVEDPRSFSLAIYYNEKGEVSKYEKVLLNSFFVDLIVDFFWRVIPVFFIFWNVFSFDEPREKYLFLQCGTLIFFLFWSVFVVELCRDFFAGESIYWYLSTIFLLAGWLVTVILARKFFTSSSFFYNMFWYVCLLTTLGVIESDWRSIPLLEYVGFLSFVFLASYFGREYYERHLAKKQKLMGINRKPEYCW